MGLLSCYRAEFAKKFLIGFTAGTLASCCNIPFDVAKSRIQGPQPEQGKVKYRGTLRDDDSHRAAFPKCFSR